MQTVEQVLAQLDSVEKDISDIKLEDSDFRRLQAKFSRLSSQLAVNHSLSNTIRQLEDSNGVKLRQTRIEKFIKVVYGGARCSSSGDSSRWASLHNLDCEAFLLIAASYTPVDVAKMSRTEFECLIAIAPTRLNEPPEKWMFRTEFQLAVAAHAEVGDMHQFKKRYHELEYSIPDVEGSRKRRRTETEQHTGNVQEDPHEGQKDDNSVPLPHASQGAGQETSGVRYLNGAETSGGLGIETAFEMTPEVFEKIWTKLCHEREAGEPQSIILTIPTEDRVGSIVYSIPRRIAILCGKEYNLPQLYLPTSA
ncbi:hypothetical protein PSPO01_15686 [Paraphaeosphaeria sporulosa]